MEDDATVLFQGDSVTDVSRKREDDCLNLEPTRVSILIGINDCWRRYDQHDPSLIEAFDALFTQAASKCHLNILYEEMIKMEKGFSDRMMPAPVGNGFKMEGYWVWCGSVIKGEDGRFHMFASRWPNYLPMHPGWLVASEVVRAVSDTPEGPYEFQEVVLPPRGAQYWDGRMTHNPHIMKHKDKYILFYTGSTHPFPDATPEEACGLDNHKCIVARSNKRIGIATSDSILGPWKRLDQPILSTRLNKFDSFLTTNPAPCIHEDGSVLMIYKARRYEGNTHGDMTIGIAKADHYEGPYYVVTENPIFPEKYHIEDPFIWKTPEGYELIAKDMNGNICGERHAGVHAFSKDGLKWDMIEGKKAYSRKVTWDDGVERVMGNLERPFLLFQEGKPTHFFAATADGTGGFNHASKTWNMVIPLE